MADAVPNLQEYDITVGDPPQPSAQPALRACYPVREGLSIAENGALVAYSESRPAARPRTNASSNIRARSRRVVGLGEHPARRPLLRDEPRARCMITSTSAIGCTCFDGFAGWDPKYRIKVRVICSRPYHALFMHTMLIRPTKKNWRRSASRTSSSATPGPFHPTVSPPASIPRRVSA